MYVYDEKRGQMCCGERGLLDTARSGKKCAAYTYPVNCINEQLILAVRTVSAGVFCAHKWLSSLLLLQVDGNDSVSEWCKDVQNSRSAMKDMGMLKYLCENKII